MWGQLKARWTSLPRPGKSKLPGLSRCRILIPLFREGLEHQSIRLLSTSRERGAAPGDAYLRPGCVRARVRAYVCVRVCVRACWAWGRAGARARLFSEALISNAGRSRGAGREALGRASQRPGVFAASCEPRLALLCQIPGRLAREPVSLLPSEWGPGGKARAPRLGPRRPLLPRGSV